MDDTSFPAVVTPAAVPLAGLKEAMASATRYLDNAKSPATRRAYLSDAKDFRAWCNLNGLVPIPAAVATVAAYLSSCADRGLRASTITRKVAAIRYMHRVESHEPPTNSESCKELLKGIRRSLGTSAVRKAPVTVERLLALLEGLPDTLQARRDRAMLAIGFAAALRRSELVALNFEDIEQTQDGILLHIRRSKTDQEGAGNSVAIPFGSRLRPVKALQDWLEAANITAGPVFRAIGKGGKIAQPSRLTDRTVANVVKACTKAAGLDWATFSGHSLRAGFVTTALERGADILRVMDVTRHKEVRTLKAYDRRAKAFKDHAGRDFL